MKHLWEYNHPYMCRNERWGADTTKPRYSSWEEFYADWGTSEESSNLVFRWDWRLAGIDWELSTDVLFVYILKQRDGIFVPLSVIVERADEDAVRAWLSPRWRLMHEMWAGLSYEEAGKSGGDGA